VRRARDHAHHAAGRDVVAIEGDVEVAQGQLAPADVAEQAVDALAEEGAPRVDADDGELLLLLRVLLDDLVGDARQGASHLVGREDHSLGIRSRFRHKKCRRPRRCGTAAPSAPFPSLRTWLKGPAECSSGAGPAQGAGATSSMVGGGRRGRIGANAFTSA
jgi:hypothetical protein